MSAARRWSRGFAVLMATLAAGGAAEAGRTSFGWVRATEVVPERAVELETWIFEENGIGGDGPGAPPDQTALWWTTVVGLTDRIELAFPIEFRHLATDDPGGTTLFYGFGAEARWRLVSPDPVEAGRFAPLVWLGAHRLVNVRDQVRGDGGVALGADIGRVQAAADVAARWTVGDGESTFALAPAGGASVRIVDQLRAGGEVYGELALRGPDQDWLAVGPNLAWTHGRFWVTGAVLIGLIDSTTAPRLNWGVAF